MTPTATTASPLLAAGICSYGHSVRGPQDTVLRAAGRCCRACAALADAEQKAVSRAPA
jgi:hypothetical protein